MSKGRGGNALSRVRSAPRVAPRVGGGVKPKAPSPKPVTFRKGAGRGK